MRAMKHKFNTTSILCVGILGLAACSSDPVTSMNGGSNSDAGTNPAGNTDAGAMMIPDSGPPPPTGLAILGNYSHSLDQVQLTVVADVSNDINQPTDLEFHPDRPNEVWVTNQGTSTFWVGTDVGESFMQSNWLQGRGAHLHFLTKPTALAFGDQFCGNDRCFATSHGNVNDQPRTTGGAPTDFMGPSLWTSDTGDYSGSGPYHAAHYDMLHNSPNGMGIAWDKGNAFWLFDGYHSSITRYDFHNDHGGGGSDHSDGEISRWVQGSVEMLEDVPSHLAFDQTTGYLYIADSGNNRIALLDTKSGVRGANYNEDYDGISRGKGMYRMQATLSTFIEGSSVGLQKPSGMVLHDNHLFVSDHGTGTIYAFNLEGEMVDYLETFRGDGTVAGLNFDASGNLYFADKTNEQIVRISVKQ